MSARENEPIPTPMGGNHLDQAVAPIDAHEEHEERPEERTDFSRAPDSRLAYRKPRLLVPPVHADDPVGEFTFNFAPAKYVKSTMKQADISQACLSRSKPGVTSSPPSEKVQISQKVTVDQEFVENDNDTSPSAIEMPVDQESKHKHHNVEDVQASDNPITSDDGTPNQGSKQTARKNGSANEKKLGTAFEYEGEGGRIYNTVQNPASEDYFHVNSPDLRGQPAEELIEPSNFEPSDSNSRILKPLNKNYRVTKRTPKTLMKTQAGPRTTFRGSAPSQEELIYLLLRTTRQRDHTESQVSAKQEDLVEQNKRLQNTNKVLHTQVNTLVTEATESSKAMEHFKRKYDKIKTWAKEINEAYAQIQTRSDHFDNEIVALQEEKNSIRALLTAAQGDASQNSVALGSIKTRLTAFTSHVDELNHKMEHCEDKAAKSQQQGFGNIENQLADIMSRLESCHKSLEETIIKERTETVTHLDVVSTKLEQQKNSKITELLQNQLSKIELLRSDGTSYAKQVEHLLDGLNSVQHSQTSLETVIKQSGADLSSTIAGTCEKLTSLADLIHTLDMTAETKLNLQNQIVALKAQNTVATGRCINLEKDKVAISLYNTGLLAVQKLLVEEHRSSKITQVANETSKLQSQCGDLELKWNDTKTQLIESQNDLRATRANLDALKLTHGQLEESLRTEKDKNAIYLQENGQLKACKNKTAEELILAREEAKQASQESNKARLDRDNLNTELLVLQQSVAELPGLRATIQDQTDEISRLNQLRSDFDAVSGQLESAQNESQLAKTKLENASMAYACLQKKIDTLEHTAAKLPELKSTLEKTRKELLLAESEGLKTKALDEKLRCREQEINRLRETVDQLQDENTQITELTEESSKQRQEIDRLKDELEDARNRCERYNSLQQQLKDRDRKCCDLQTEANNLKVKLQGSAEVQEQLRQKEDQLADLETQITCLHAKHRELEDFCHQVPEELMNQFLSQHSQFSLPSMFEMTQPRESEVTSTFDNSEQIADIVPIRRAADRSIQIRKPEANITFPEINSGQSNLGVQTEIIPDSQRDTASSFQELDSNIVDSSADVALSTYCVAFERNSTRGEQSATNTQVGERSLRNGDTRHQDHSLSSQSRSETSQSEMLLRSPQHDEQIAMAGSAFDVELAVSSTFMNEKSPMRLRSGSQAGYTVPLGMPQQNSDNSPHITSPAGLNKEHHQPNSAAKRRMTTIGSNDRKRLRCDTRTQSSQLQHVTNLDSTYNEDTESNNTLEIAIQGRDDSPGIKSSACVAGKPARKVKASRRKTKADKYSQKFRAD